MCVEVEISKSTITEKSSSSLASIIWLKMNNSELTVLFEHFGSCQFSFPNRGSVPREFAGQYSAWFPFKLWAQREEKALMILTACLRFLTPSPASYQTSTSLWRQLLVIPHRREVEARPGKHRSLLSPQSLLHSRDIHLLRTDRSLMDKVSRWHKVHVLLKRRHFWTGAIPGLWLKSGPIYEINHKKESSLFN